MSVRPDGLKYPCYWMYKDNKNEWRWVYYGVNIVKASGSSTVFEPRGS
jgi:hypothetical protein